MDDDQPVVLDTTVLSNFASTDSIGWVVELLERPIVVSAVRDELERGVEAGHHYLEEAIEAIGNDIELVEPEEYPPFHKAELDVGERESMAVALAQEGVLATDDLAAREAAGSHKLPITGSIGLLVLGIERDLIDVETADRWLTTWRAQRSYHSPIERISEAFEE